MAYKNMYMNTQEKDELDRLYRQANISWTKELKTLKNLGVKDGHRILEVGSGPGFVTELLFKGFNDIKVTSIDIDGNLINVAKERLGNSYEGRLEFVETYVEETPFEDNTFDIAICRLVFQHLSKPMDAAKEIHRVLKPGGKIIILDVDNGMWGTTYPENNFLNMLNEGVGSFQGKTGGDRQVGRKLLKILKKSEFEEVDFEIIPTHSDIVGKEYFKSRLKMPTMSKRMNMMQKQVYNMMKSCENFFDDEETCIILLMIVAIGTKK